MAIEGVFPKIDGDILYASEANQFEKYGGYAGSFSAMSGAPNVFQDMGSILIAGDTFKQPVAYLDLSYTTTDINAGGVFFNLQLQISGPVGNFNVAIGSWHGTGSSELSTRHIIPLTNHINTTTQPRAISTIIRDGILGHQIPVCGSIFLGSNFVVNFQSWGNEDLEAQKIFYGLNFVKQNTV